jgi:hypothetical protein
MLLYYLSRVDAPFLLMATGLYFSLKTLEVAQFKSFQLPSELRADPIFHFKEKILFFFETNK